MVSNMDEKLQKKLESTLDECDKHIKWMLHAKENIQSLFPLTGENYHNLPDDAVTDIDQFVYRFTKLQDTMGTRLFSLILQILAEDTKKMSFIDILNRLEQLNIIESKDTWLKLRNLRNLAAHEYDDFEIVNILNGLYNSISVITDIYNQAKSFIVKK